MLEYLLAIVVVFGLIGIVVLFGVFLIGLEASLGRAERGLARLRAFNRQALRLAETRGRFRRGQKHVERLIDAGAYGAEDVHRTIAGPAYRGAIFYGGLRRINRYLGRSVSDWLAPRAAIRHRDSLAGWRARRTRDDNEK